MYHLRVLCAVFLSGTILCSYPIESRSQTSITFPITNVHFNTPKKIDAFNDVNIGAGAAHLLSADIIGVGVRAGGYWNSYYRFSIYGGLYLEYPTEYFIRLRVTVGYVSGYDIGKDLPRAFGIPMPVTSPSIVIGKKYSLEIQALWKAVGFSLHRRF